MVHKRSVDDELPYEIACKHPRQQEPTAQQSPVGEIASCDGGSQKPLSDGEGENIFNKSLHGGGIARHMVNEDLNEANFEFGITRHTVSEDLNMEFGIGASGSVPSYLWVSGNPADEYMESEAAFQFHLFPSYFEFDHQVQELIQSDAMYSTHLDHLPRIPIPVGPEYQADVPNRAPQIFSRSPNCLDKSDVEIDFAQHSGSFLVDDNDNGINMFGTCVVPMPDLESSAENWCETMGTGNNCNCLDKGSVECVRQHVKEAREKLMENLGHKIFVELGFFDMGEEVAKKWSEEEEQVFHEVVVSNPQLLGKNFWDHLTSRFPSRTKKDLVSYYFNVFMLRKRAEQNRFDPLNIDSDSDEWQRSDSLMSEEDYDSVVESPVIQDELVHNHRDHEENFLEGSDNDDGTDNYEDDADIVNHRYERDEEGGDIYDVSEAQMESFVGSCDLDALSKLSAKILHNSSVDPDTQDDSCTSYDYPSDKLDSSEPRDLGIDARESPIDRDIHYNSCTTYLSDKLDSRGPVNFGTE